MKKKIISLALLMSLLVGLLSGCSFGFGDTVNEISKIPSMTLDEVAGKRLISSTTEEVEAEIYKYVSDRIVVDGSKLIKVNSEDERNITKLLSNINVQLSGKSTEPLTPEYANYLLLEFAKTPYEWVQSNKEIVGFDPAARLYFVDVTYSTTTTKKNVVASSKIANGNPEGEILKQKRYTDYLTLLTLKQKGDDAYPLMFTTFTNRWGAIADIFNEQQGVSLYERTIQKANEITASVGGIGRLTYEGLVLNDNLNRSATMTVRYVLKYALNLGEETDLSVEALYVKNFSLDNYETILSNYKLKDSAALEVLKPFIDKLILSYNKCVEESNQIGLYQLYQDYNRIDKYYDEIRDYSYNSIGGYTYEILSRNGKEVAVKVNLINQIRAKGAEMSLPTYEEVLIFDLVLGQNDTILIKDVYLVSRKLIGEPLSVIKNVTGISDQIQYSDVAFSAINKEGVEKLLKQFSQVVTNSDITSQDFLTCVDLGVSSNTLNRMVDTITAIKPNKKSMYIVSWNTKTNVYCSLTVREVFECNNGNFDTESVIDIGNRNGVWKIVNYTRTLNIKTNGGNVDTSSAFVVNENTSGNDVTTIEGETKKPEVEDIKPTDIPVDNKEPLLPNEPQNTDENNIPETDNNFDANIDAPVVDTEDTNTDVASDFD